MEEPFKTETLERSFLSTCFSSNISGRHGALSKAHTLQIRPTLLLTVFLGFTKDPYPYIREVSLDGLVEISKSVFVDDLGLVKCCLGRGVELLYDFEHCVREAAIRVVIHWGKILVGLNHDNTKKDVADALFIQLCSVVRDMNVKVRVQAFNALGELDLVSDDILLQTLSKKVLPVMEKKSYHVLCSAKPIKILVSSAAGAFVHGLEDEFCEVRRSACHSLHTLSIISAKFADVALNLLIEVLNDDSMVVRRQALETMQCMALYNNLKLQDTRMHTFLSTLVDADASVRTAARKVLKVVKLENWSMFRLCTDDLLGNLEMHPQDEADVLFVLFNMGRSHGPFAVKFIEGVLDEIEPSTDGKLGFDNRRIAALLVLAISAPLSHEQHRCLIPPRLFSYAVTMLGRISLALSDVVDQDTLLAYLSHCSSSDVVSAADFQFTKKEPLLLIESDAPPTVRSNINGELLKDHDGGKEPVELVFAKIYDNWKLIQLGFIGEVRKTLSGWKEELASFDCISSSDAIAFTYMYLKVMKILAILWPRYLSQRRICSYQIGNLDLLLKKLDESLKEMQYKFIGFSEREEIHVLEIMLLNFVLRLSIIEAYSETTTLSKLHKALTRVEFLSNELCIELSNFVTGLRKLLDKIDYSFEPPLYNPFLFQKLLESFSLKQLIISGKFKHVKAEMDVQKNDFENPLRFISGLPVGIPLDITLYNVSRKNRLWLKLVASNVVTEFLFIDLDRFGGSNKIRNFKFVAPFYKTPRASPFTTRIHLGMECLSEDFHPPNLHGGPKRELVYLCKEKEVFLSAGKK